MINYFAHISDGASPLVLFGRGGLVEYADLGTGADVRAIATMGGAQYAVSDGRVWKITAATATEIGSVADGETHMAASFDELAIVSGGRYYICDGTGVTEYTTGAVTSATGVAFLDGYFIVTGEAAGRADALTVSSLDDGTTFDALEFAYAESNPDALVGLIADHNELWAFGTDTVQVFYNSGELTFPFTPNKGALIEQGCVSGASIAKADNAVFWVTPDGKVGRSFGSGPEWIDTAEIRRELSESTISGAYTFSERGHEFYAIRRTEGTTLVVDLKTGLWHERAAGLSGGPWGATCGHTFGGVEYFGTSDGRVATIGEDTYTDFGEVLAAEAVSPIVENSGQPFRVARLHLDISGGGDDIDRTPQVMLQSTRDGFNWGEEHWRDLAGPGQYGKRVTWHALGQFRRGAIRVRITDPVSRDIHGVAVDRG
ncbi:MAG: hypothetical protein ACRBB0_15245 [Pelagimonas sp.]|uniref:hypothetical protein n=1 Tax=Pelagimonas sp. TaxID=2073170 RepID=UPI003D6A2DCA